MPYMVFKDAIKEGDTDRCNVSLKTMLPFFYGHSVRSKYAVECLDYIMKTEAVLSPQLALRTRLGSFVNTLGGQGQNKPADMQQENNVRSIKDVFKGLGAGKTDKSMDRASSAAPVLSDIVTNYEHLLDIHVASGAHIHRSNSEDVKRLLIEINDIKPLENRPNRKLKNYRVRSTPFDFDPSRFSDYVQKTVNRLKLSA